MKQFHLIFTKDNLVQENGYWVSDLIDLYENDFYTNYSATKSTYGTNQLDDGTWTGFDDEGRIDGDRFIDHSGVIDIDYFSIRFPTLNANPGVHTYVDIFTSPDPDAHFPEEFASLLDINNNSSIRYQDAHRYARFRFTIVSDIDIVDVDFDLVITVSISAPLVSPLYETTRRMLNKFPEWMELREDSVQPATPSMATPQTVAGQLLNSIAGEWLDHIQNQLTVQSVEQYIDTLDANTPSKAYRVVDIPEFPVSIKGDGVELTRASSRYEFYDAIDNELLCYIDLEDGNNNIITFHKFEEFTIDGEEYEQHEFSLWNVFDEFGLLVDLSRLPDESNSRFRERILDVHRNQPGVTLESLKLTLRRELDLWRVFDVPIDQSATPATEAATPEILDMGHLGLDDRYWADDGMPTARFINLVESLNKEFPTTWGYLIWNEAFWDTNLDSRVENYGLLPNRFDATPLTSDELQTGVGDLDDLLITRPSNNVSTDSLTLTFSARGVEKVPTVIYPQVIINAGFFGQADKTVYEAEEVTHPFVLRLEPQGGGGYIYVNFTMSAISDIDAESPVPSDNAIDIVSLSDDYYGSGVLGGTVYYPGEEEGEELTEENIFRGPLESASWTTGHWDPDTSTVINKPSTNNFIALDSVTQTQIDKDSGWALLELEYIETEETTGNFLYGYVSFQSLEYDTSVEKWRSPGQKLDIGLNGKLPDLTTASSTFAVPNVMWDSNLEDPPNKEYVIVLSNTDADGNYGALMEGPDGAGVFLPASYIYVNGSNAWVDGEMVFDADTTDSFTVSTGTGELYPVDSYTLNAISGTKTVDIDDLQSILEYSSSDFYRNKSSNDIIFLGDFVIDKADFGFDNSDEQIITWIGIEANNEKMDCWLESNIVQPLQPLDPELSYPSNAITEQEDESDYVFSNIVAFMKIKPGPNKFWNPQMNTGWVYMDGKELYVYHKSATDSVVGEQATLNEPPQQGAPIIVKVDDAEYRQVAFHEDATPSLTLVNTEIKKGNGRDKLFVGYSDIYDITVFNLHTQTAIAVPLESDTNVIELSEPTTVGHDYEIKYKVKNSFYVDHENRDDNYALKPLIVFDSPDGTKSVTYETSLYEHSTPIDVPLNPFYTSTEESFIFISSQEYDPFYAEIKLSPQVIVANDDDYILITIKCYDTWGNPKVGYEYDIASSFGTLQDTSVVTDEDGYAYTFLYSEPTDTTTGLIQISNDDNPDDMLDAEVSFGIYQPKSFEHILVAVPSHEFIPADSEDNVSVAGAVFTPDMAPVPNAIVRYRIGRTIEEALSQNSADADVVVDEDLRLKEDYDGSWPTVGKTFTNASGRFSIGPFTTQDSDNSGYFFIIVESQKVESDISDSNVDRGDDSTEDWPIVGDIAMWYEYPQAILGIEGHTLVPKPPEYISTEDAAPEFIPSAYPVAYSELKVVPATPDLYDIELPRWYSIDKYEQYQMGLLGDIENAVSSTYYSEHRHPEHKDI